MVKSHKGVEVDMSALIASNSKAIALGNGKMNANGDIIGKGGKVIKTRDALAREYHTKNPKAAKNVSLTKDMNEVIKKDTASNAPQMNAEHKTDKKEKKAKKVEE